MLDVRTPVEFKQRHIDGALNIPLSRLGDRLGPLGLHRAVVVYCASGYRSAIAASLMLRANVPRVTDLVGGLTAWDAAGLPTSTGVAPEMP